MKSSPARQKKDLVPDARAVAALSLFAMEEEGAWSEVALHQNLSRAGLSKRDAAFAARLLYGTVQNALLLDWYLRKFSSVRLKKIAPRVRNCLRLGLYELIMLDKIPCHAAVNETVGLVRRYCRGNERTVSFANAVMRSAAKAAQNGALPRLDCPDKESYYSLQYSHPEWLVRELSAEYGVKLAGEICKADNEYAPISVRVNLMKTAPEPIITELETAGITVTQHEKAPEILLCSGGDVTALAAFREGKITVQDTAGVVAVAAASPEAGMFVLDCCAAPGGKSFLMAEKMRDTGRVASCDIYPHKLERIKEGAGRLGMSIIEPVLQDAREPRGEWLNAADVVLCDAPCSGFGIIRKKPEIRYRDKDEAEGLPELQLSILSNCAKYVKRGGVLVYSTCTILPRENEGVVNSFLSRNPGFSPEAWEHPVCGRAGDGMITLLTPVHNTDGFFIAKMRKKT